MEVGLLYVAVFILILKVLNLERNVDALERKVAELPVNKSPDGILRVESGFSGQSVEKGDGDEN